MRVQLFCICSFLALALAIEDPNLYLAPHGISEDTYVVDDNTLSKAIDFPFKMNGVQMNSIRISTNGAVFPSPLLKDDNTGDIAGSDAYGDFSNNNFAILGPIWGSLHIGAHQTGSKNTNSGLYYRVMTNTAIKDKDFLREWGKKVSVDSSAHNIDPVRGLVVTWWRMENPLSSASDDRKYINAQLIIIIDINNVAWAFYNYGDFQWAPKAVDVDGDQVVPLRIGYSTANGATAEYYETYLSGTNDVTKQSNFYFKLSADPRVDTWVSDARYAATSKDVSARYIGQSFTVTATTSGPTAFNFRQGGKPFALTGSTLVCFTAAYTGAAKKLAPGATPAPAGIFARSRVVTSVEGVYEFPATVVFTPAQYYCYIDTAMPASTSLTMLVKSTRQHKNSYISKTANNAQTFNGATVSTSAFAYEFQSVLLGKGMNDPIFNSLRTGDSFIFQGEAGKYFNIYHDEWTNLNAEFKFSNPATEEGTVMNSVGIMVGGHKISFAADDFAATTLTVTLDGKQVKLVDEKVHLSGCVDVHYQDTGKGMYFFVVTPSHVFKFWHNERHTDHIDGSFINLAVEDLPSQGGNREVGGVLGQTAFGGPINLKTADFAATGLFGVESSRFFKATTLDC